MNVNKKEIDQIKQQLTEIGTMHPGSVSQQYQVCGNPNCRCMKKKDPQRHGPYTKLAYVYHGKPVCRFVRAACVTNMKTRLSNYKKFRALMDKWIELSIEQGMIDFFTPAPKRSKKES
ncbi:MAG: hypothetical protein KAH38_08970 [Candidatus Hydrogenedentes bacterium]|nr:hypothetical protein [Candidatus Hydrogenedentota bacterium]